MTKRYTQGLNSQVSFTAGKLIDDASQTVTFLGAAGTSRTSTTAPRNGRSLRRIFRKRFVIGSDYELPSAEAALLKRRRRQSISPRRMAGERDRDLTDGSTTGDRQWAEPRRSWKSGPATQYKRQEPEAGRSDRPAAKQILRHLGVLSDGQLPRSAMSRVLLEIYARRV